MMIRWLALFLASILTYSPTLASERLRGPIPATLVRVIDGDTLKVRAKIWIGQTIDISVRVRGIDTPELSSTCPKERLLAQKAQQRLKTLLSTPNSKTPIILRHISQGKYAGRVIAYVNNGAGVSVGDALLKEKIAKPYRRNKARTNWCGQLSMTHNQTTQQ